MSIYDMIYYPIIKLMDGSNIKIEVPHTWLQNGSQPISKPIVGAYYYCSRYKCGCVVLTLGA